MDIALETKKIIAEDSRGSVGTTLLWFIQKALPEKAITIYEAFQLMEITDRYMHDDDKFWSTPSRVVNSMNLALLSKLFNEDNMYDRFCEDARKRRDIWYKVIKKSNGGKMPEVKHYILNDLDGYLNCDLEHIEKLCYVREHTHRNSRKDDPYQWTVFPYDYFKYEHELLKLLKGEIDHYAVEKTISPEICDMMVAVEVRVYEIEL